MSDNFNTGAAAMLLWIFTIVISIGAGILTWNWIEPESFLGFLAFIIIWGILSRIGHFIAFGIFASLFK